MTVPSPSSSLVLPSARGAANGRNIAKLLTRSMYRLEVLDADRVPKHGKLIIASNHTGMLDGPVLFGAAPRPVHWAMVAGPWALP